MTLRKTAGGIDPATQHWAVSGCQLYPN